MPSLTICLLCRNRPDYARQAISSILGQTSCEFSLVVSDNSSNDEVELMVRSEFPAIRYIRRRPALELLEHFNRCIAEAEGDYFCLFHDDDIMAPDFVEKMQAGIRAHPSAIAIGCNARMEKFGKLEPRTSFRSFRTYERIDTARELARRYFAPAQLGFAPFPGYIYKRELVGKQLLPPESGKYADVIWLLSLAAVAPIIWLSDPLMTYRLHESNDSNVESMRDRLCLLGFLKQNARLFDAGVLDDYRCSFIYKPLARGGARRHPAWRQVAIDFLRRYRWARYARPGYYGALAMRLLAKLMAGR